MIKKNMLLCTIIIALLLVTSACLKNGPTAKVVSDASSDASIITKPIRIGAILSLTGPGASVGNTLRQGLEWKIRELNNQGYNIELYVEDSQSDPKQGIAAFSKLVDVDKVDIIFTIMSSVSITLKPLAEEKHVLLWADTAHPEMTTNSSYIIRHSNLADLDAINIAKHIRETGFKSTGIIYSQDDYGVTSNKAMVEALTKFNIITFSESVDPKASDFKTQITKLKLKHPESIAIFSSGSSTGMLAKQLGELEYKGRIYSSIVLALTPNAMSIAEEYLNGTYYEVYKYNDSTFKADYEKMFGKEPFVVGFLGYTDMELLMHAIQETGSTKPEDIVRFIKSLNEFKGKYEAVKINPNGDIILETEVRVWGG